MLGFRYTDDNDIDDKTEALINSTLFAEVTQNLTLGMEVNVATGGEETTSWLLMPQIHYEISKNVEIQIGAGASKHHGDWKETAGLRMIYEF